MNDAHLSAKSSAVLSPEASPMVSWEKFVEELLKESYLVEAQQVLLLLRALPQLYRSYHLPPQREFFQGEEVWGWVIVAGEDGIGMSLFVSSDRELYSYLSYLPEHSRLAVVRADSLVSTFLQHVASASYLQQVAHTGKLVSYVAQELRYGAALLLRESLPHRTTLNDEVWFEVQPGCWVYYDDFLLAPSYEAMVSSSFPTDSVFPEEGAGSEEQGDSDDEW